MLGFSEPLTLLARREGPTESGYNYAMEKDKGKLDWAEGKQRGGHYLKEWKTPLWENLPLWNKVRAFSGSSATRWVFQKDCCWTADISQSGFFYLNHRGEETQKQSSGPGLWYTVLLWEKAVRRLERNLMSSVSRVAVLCSAAMVTAKMMRGIKVRQQPWLFKLKKYTCECLGGYNNSNFSME